MNAFSPVRIELHSSRWLLFLYLLTYILGSVALFRVDIPTQAAWLSYGAYSLILALLLWRDIYLPSDEQITGLYWDVEHRHFAVKTGCGDWVEIQRIDQACSFPGLVQILLLQRQDRYALTRLVITPDRLTADDRRRLHVAINWSAPLEPRPAKDSWPE